MNTNKEIQTLIESNLKLVPYIYHKFAKTAVIRRNEEDMISEGYMGLIKSAKNYDETKCKFSSFAGVCIRNEMLMYLRKISKYIGKEVSLYTPVGNDKEGNEILLIDTIEDKKSYQSENIGLQEIMKFIQKQNSRDKKILLLKESGMTTSNIGSVLGISQSYISRLINKMKKQYCLEQNGDSNGNKKNRYRNIESSKVQS